MKSSGARGLRTTVSEREGSTGSIDGCTAERTIGRSQRTIAQLHVYGLCSAFADISEIGSVRSWIYLSIYFIYPLSISAIYLGARDGAPRGECGVLQNSVHCAHMQARGQKDGHSSRESDPTFRVSTQCVECIR